MAETVFLIISIHIHIYIYMRVYVYAYELYIYTNIKQRQILANSLTPSDAVSSLRKVSGTERSVQHHFF